MSYQVYITRGSFWAENEGKEIAAEEWLELIRADPELRHDPRNGRCFAVSNDAETASEFWLDWSEGNIFAASPNHAAQRKMLEIAGQLAAIVQGDDGEIYATIDDFPEPAVPQHATSSGSRGLPAYRRRELLWSFLTYGTIAAVILSAIYFDLW